MQNNAFVKAAVIGHPIDHSLSPLIHNHWIKTYGLSGSLAGSYVAIDIAPENLVQDIREMIETGFSGFNVTIPYKRAVFELCDYVDESAKAVGAVNTVVIKDKKLHGMNTDVFGFTENIKQSAPDFDFRAGTALVLGAGGAARAAISGLKQQNASQIILTNRTKEKAETLAKEFSVSVLDWKSREDVTKDLNLLVNATSLGMTGQAELTFDLTNLPKAALVCDIVYKPLYTNLLLRAKEHGNRTITGIGMLLHQARPAFKEWFGVIPEIDNELKKNILRNTT